MAQDSKNAMFYARQIIGFGSSMAFLCRVLVSRRLYFDTAGIAAEDNSFDMSVDGSSPHIAVATQ
jgi:hypothetical protein